MKEKNVYSRGLENITYQKKKIKQDFCSFYVMRNGRRRPTNVGDDLAVFPLACSLTSRFDSQANHRLLYVNKETFQNFRLKKLDSQNVFIIAVVA